MKPRKIILFFLFLLIKAGAFSQYPYFPDRKVYASAGGDLTNQNTVPNFMKYRITFTVGEPFTIIPLPNSTLQPIQNKFFNTGFIQPDGLLIGPGVSAMTTISDPFKIAPNPVSDFATLIAPDSWNGIVLVKLMDSQGKLVRDLTMEESRLLINFHEGLTTGVYFLNIYTLAGNLLQQNKIIKI